MTHPRNIPRSATLTMRHGGLIVSPGTPNDGKAVQAERWAAYESDGYKTDYTARPTEYIVVRVEGARPWCKRYSGGRLPAAGREWARICSLVLAASPAEVGS